MSFAFEDLKVYQKALDFAVSVIDVIDDLDTPITDCMTMLLKSIK